MRGCVNGEEKKYEVDDYVLCCWWRVVVASFMFSICVCLYVVVIVIVCYVRTT